jgi:predicted kinase
MDLLYRGHRELARTYLEAYVESSGDVEQWELMPTLVRYRAMVRAKVSAIVTAEPEINEEDRVGALASAKHHMNLCAASAIAEDGSLLVIACGLPASGKTYVFEELARETGWPYLSSDHVRKELAGVPPETKLAEDFYSVDLSRRVYCELIGRGVKLLHASPVLLDANFRSVDLRQMVTDRVREAKVQVRGVVVVWFQTDEKLIERRLTSRADQKTSVSDADVEVYRKLQYSFEDPSEGEEYELVIVDGGAERDEILCRIFSKLMKL